MKHVHDIQEVFDTLQICASVPHDDISTATRRFILLEADGEMSPWSKLCVSQADCVLLVAAPDASPQVPHRRPAESLQQACFVW